MHAHGNMRFLVAVAAIFQFAGRAWSCEHEQQGNHSRCGISNCGLAAGYGHSPCSHMAFFLRDTLLGRDTLLHSNTPEDTSHFRVLEISSARGWRIRSQQQRTSIGLDEEIFDGLSRASRQFMNKLVRAAHDSMDEYARDDLLTAAVGGDLNGSRTPSGPANNRLWPCSSRCRFDQSARECRSRAKASRPVPDSPMISSKGEERAVRLSASGQFRRVTAKQRRTAGGFFQPWQFRHPPLGY